MIIREKDVEYFDELDDENSLSHYGVPGMKWGVIRRARTAIGNRRAARQQKKLQKQRSAIEKQSSSKRKEKLSTLSTEELNRRTARLNAERNYVMAKQQHAAVTKKQKTSLGKAFVKKVGKDVIQPVAINVGKSYLEGVLRKQLGLKGVKGGFLDQIIDKD